MISLHKHIFDKVSLPRLLVVVNDRRNFFLNYIEPFFLEHFEFRDFDVNNDSLYNKNPVYRNRTPDSDFRLRNIMNSYVQDLNAIVNNFLPPSKIKANDLILLLL